MKFSPSAICNGLLGYTFGYGTPKVVHIRSFKVGLVNRLIQIAVIVYVIGYVIFWRKGYQDKDVGQSTVTVKLKGIASTLDDYSVPPVYRRVWDTSEFAPVQEYGAFFVLTNAIITPNQTVSVCPEDPGLKSCNPSERKSCVRGVPVSAGHGVMTGQCVPSSFAPGNYSCQIRGWCPVEKDALILKDRPLIPEAANFTVFIRSNIEFVKFGRGRSNILEGMYSSEDYLKSCRYDPNSATGRYCPVFWLEDIVAQTTTEKHKTTFRDIGIKGGVIGIYIYWDCDLDMDIKHCLPKYSFRRLDDPPVPISPGYNFRYARYYRLPNGTEIRDLIKAHGILFILNVQAKAGKFNFIPLALNIGAGLGLFGLAKILTDFVLLNLTRRRKEYKEHKYTRIIEEDFHKVQNKFKRDSKPAPSPSSLDSQTQGKEESVLTEV